MSEASIGLDAVTGAVRSAATFEIRASGRSLSLARFAANGLACLWNDAITAPAASQQITDCAHNQPAWASSPTNPQALGMLNGQTLVAAKDNVTRIGTGCRFASCSDDQTNFDYHHKGWRLNLTGRY